MKKYIRVFLAVTIILLIIKFLSSIFYKGRDVHYEIEKENNLFEIYERYVKERALNYYYLEIDFLSKKFNFRISSSFDNGSYIVKDIYSFNDENYTCVLPIFMDNSIQTDILCYIDDSYIYPYRSLANDSLKLDKFATSMESYGYRRSSELEDNISKFGIKLFKNNLPSSHLLVIPSYNGVFRINEDITTNSLFEKDIYEQSIQAVVSNYYVVVDYDEAYSFHEFRLVNLKTGKVSTIASNTSISMNSYVQGVVGNSMYIVDRSNKKQYEIDISDMSVTIVGNTKKGALYYNGNEFETVSIYAAINEDLLFASYSTSSDYGYIYSVQNIYYSYKKVDNGYDVYVSYNENPSLYTYAFTTSSIERIQYIDDYVYYIDKDTLYYYHPSSGVIKLLTYNELFYNPNLKFWIYKK